MVFIAVVFLILATNPNAETEFCPFVHQYITNAVRKFHQAANPKLVLNCSMMIEAKREAYGPGSSNIADYYIKYSSGRVISSTSTETPAQSFEMMLRQLPADKIGHIAGGTDYGCNEVTRPINDTVTTTVVCLYRNPPTSSIMDVLKRIVKKCCTL